MGVSNRHVRFPMYSLKLSTNQYNHLMNKKRKRKRSARRRGALKVGAVGQQYQPLLSQRSMGSRLDRQRRYTKSRIDSGLWDEIDNESMSSISGASFCSMMSKRRNNRTGQQVREKQQKEEEEKTQE